MKRIILITAIAISILSCKKEVPQPSSVTTVDCYCNKVISVVTTGPSQGFFSSTYVTYNECSKEELTKTYTSTNLAMHPKVGDCW